MERIASLKILGPQNRKDLLLQYAIESGYIDADPLENVMHPERMQSQETETLRRRQYQRGILNPRARANPGYGSEAITADYTMADGQKKSMTERAYNARALTGRDPENTPGKPHVPGYVTDYRAILQAMRPQPKKAAAAAADEADGGPRPLFPGLNPPSADAVFNEGGL